MERCAYHPTQPAVAVCPQCRLYVCLRCLPPQVTPPLCWACSARSSPAPRPGGSAFDPPASASGRPRWVGLGPAGFFAGAGLFFGLAASPWYFTLLAVPALVVLLNAARTLAAREGRAHGAITTTQVLTLLERRHNRLTPGELARATDTSETEAKEALDALVLEGTLELVPDDEGNLFYTTDKLDLTSWDEAFRQLDGGGSRTGSLGQG